MIDFHFSPDDSSLNPLPWDPATGGLIHPEDWRFGPDYIHSFGPCLCNPPPSENTTLEREEKWKYYPEQVLAALARTGKIPMNAVAVNMDKSAVDVIASIIKEITNLITWCKQDPRISHLLYDDQVSDLEKELPEMSYYELNACRNSLQSRIWQAIHGYGSGKSTTTRIKEVQSILGENASNLPKLAHRFVADKNVKSLTYRLETPEEYKSYRYDTQWGDNFGRLYLGKEEALLIGVRYIWDKRVEKAEVSLTEPLCPRVRSERPVFWNISNEILRHAKKAMYTYYGGYFYNDGHYSKPDICVVKSDNKKDLRELKFDQTIINAFAGDNANGYYVVSIIAFRAVDSGLGMEDTGAIQGIELCRLAAMPIINGRVKISLSKHIPGLLSYVHICDHDVIGGQGTRTLSALPIFLSQDSNAPRL